MRPKIHGETGSGSKLGIVFFATNGLLFATIAIGSFVPNLRLWGVDHLSYYPMSIRLAVLFLAATTLLPGVAEWIFGRWITAFEIVTASPARRGIFAVVAVLATFGLFIGFQSSTELLGDGQLQSKLLARMAVGPGASFANFSETVLSNSMAPGTNLLVYTAARIIGSDDPAAIWRFLSILLGCMFVLVTLGIAYKSRAPIEFRLCLTALLLISGAVQLFFGYIETYAPMYLLTVLYILTAVENLYGRRHILVPVFFLALAVSFHYQAVLLAPSLLFVVVSRMLVGRGIRGLRILATAIGVVTVIALIAVSRSSEWDKFFLPVFGREGTPGILDGSHIMDIINELLLIVPLAPFLVIMMAARKFAATSSTQLPLNRTSGIPAERELAFAALTHVPCVIFLFTFFPKLGVARDWDLFALPALGAAIPLIVGTHRMCENPVSRFHMKRFFVPAVAAGLAIVIPWIGVNADEARSISRYVTILELSNSDAGYGYEILAMHYEDRGDFAKKAVTYDKAYAKSGNPRHLVSACSARLRSGEIERAASTLRTYINSNPGYDLARDVYIEALVRIGDTPEVIRVCSEGIALNPNRPYFHFYLGVAYLQEGFAEKAQGAFDECRKLDPPAIMVDAINDMTGTSDP